MALQMQKFTNFTPAMYAAFAAKIKADVGVTLSADAGTITHGSFEFTYNYVRATQTFTIQCLKKPLFIPAAQIINGLAEEIAAIISSVAKTQTLVMQHPANSPTPTPPKA